MKCLFLVSILLSLGASAKVIEGYVGLPGVPEPSNEDIILRTPTQDITIQLGGLPSAVRKTLLDNDGSKTKISVDIPDSAIIMRQNYPNAVRPDCSEMPMDYEQLKSIAENPAITNTVDFLKAIPPGTLQTFTFNFQSKSAQGPGVSPEFPGIIRMSQDGKLIVRYTCDPTKPTYNKIEVLTFDDATKKYKMASLDLKKPIGNHQRIEENPKLCMSCHNPGGAKAPIDPRPNWQHYDQWTGFYGSEDDTFDSNSSFFAEVRKPTDSEMETQKQNYLNFRKNQKDNPCYSTLPWPDNAPDIYPYSETSRNSDYTRRPGLKFTEVQCHLAGQRLARKFQEKPEYPLLKYALAMNSLRCEQFRPEQITQVIPEANQSNFLRNNSRIRSDVSVPNSNFAAHFEVGKALGFRNMDWTMNFNKPNTADYNCGIGGGENQITSEYRDLTIGDIMQGALLKDLSSSVPTLKGKISTSRGESQSFGEKFACIDDLGGAPASRELNKSQICSSLAEEQTKLERDVIAPTSARTLLASFRARREAECAQIRAEDSISENLDDLMKIGVEVSLENSAPNPLRGKEIVRGVCMDCHDGSLGFNEFFESEEKTREHIKSQPNFIDTVMSRLNDSSTPMPPDSGQLKPRERLDVEAYLKTFLN